MKTLGLLILLSSVNTDHSGMASLLYEKKTQEKLQKIKILSFSLIKADRKKGSRVLHPELTI